MADPKQTVPEGVTFGDPQSTQPSESQAAPTSTPVPEGVTFGDSKSSAPDNEGFLSKAYHAMPTVGSDLVDMGKGLADFASNAASYAVNPNPTDELKATADQRAKEDSDKKRAVYHEFKEHFHSGNYKAAGGALAGLFQDYNTDPNDPVHQMIEGQLKSSRAAKELMLEAAKKGDALGVVQHAAGIVPLASQVDEAMEKYRKDPSRENLAHIISSAIPAFIPSLMRGGTKVFNAGANIAKESMLSKLAPTVEKVGDTAVPVRSETLAGKIAQSAVPDTMRKFAIEQTGPKVAEGVGNVTKEAAGTEGEVVPTQHDRLGIRSVADEVKGRSQATFQKLDELSGNMLSDAQIETEDAAGDFSKEGRKAYREALQKQDDVFEHYKDHPDFEGQDLNQAKKDWRQQVALREVSKKLSAATESSESGSMDYQFKQGKQLSEAVDTLIKNDKDVLQRAGFNDAHIDQLQKFGRIIREQANVPRFSNYMGGIAKVLAGGVGLHFGGGAGLIEGVAGEAIAERVGGFMADRLLGKALTTPRALEVLYEGFEKNVNPATLTERLKTIIFHDDPKWATTLGEKVSEQISNLVKGESGEMRIPGTGGAGTATATALEEPETTTVNGSGESAASQEAINRNASEKSQGVKRVVVDTRSGAERPLISADAVDYSPRPYESVEFRGGERDGEIIDQGKNARPYNRKPGLGALKQVIGLGDDAASAAAVKHNENGGMTFNPTKGDMNGQSAYAVAGSYPKLSKTIEGTTVTPEQLKAYASDPAVAKVLKENPDASIGTWAHDGKTDLEISVTPSDLEKAKELAKKNNQISIYDLKNGKEIQTGGTGTRESFRVGQRKPTAANGPQGHNPDLSVGLDTVMQAANDKPVYLQKLAERVSNYPTMKFVPEGAEESFNPEELATIDPHSTVKSFVQQAADNIEWMHNNTPEYIRNAAKQWYDTANKMTKEQAEANGVTHPQAAGVTAVLSPQNPWDNNISLAKRVMDVWKNKQNFKWSKEMNHKSAELYGQSDAIAKYTDMVRGKTFSQLKNADPDVELAMKALWTRIYDEAHNPRTFARFSPTGETRGLARNANGTPSTSQWFSLNPIAKAISILDDGSMENIHEMLGNNHKVRNFYNNIIDPNAQMGDTTVDTHAVGVAHLSPFGLESPEVVDNFKSPANAAHGLRGTYPLYAEAYKVAAKRLGILPRQLQSITWEGIRSLFKDKSPELQSAVRDIWKEHQDGEITIGTARKRILKAAGGFKPTEWESDFSSHEVSQPAVNAPAVSRTGVPQKEPQGSARGRSRPAPAVSREAYRLVTAGRRR